jgi:YfiH family protein
VEEYLVGSFGSESIKYLFLNKHINGSSGKYRSDAKPLSQEIMDNRNAISLIVPNKKLSFMDQRHTNIVMKISSFDSSPERAIDGQYTFDKNVALVLQTADCVPILFADYSKGIIAAVHAGWRGARSDIIKNTVALMQAEGCEKICSVIGPCIRQESYEVDGEFFKNFLVESKMNEEFFVVSQSKSDHYMFDLPGYVKSKLKDSGVSNIDDCMINTYEDENFFSYRRFTHYGGHYGSNLSVIYLL